MAKGESTGSTTGKVNLNTSLADFNQTLLSALQSLATTYGVEIEGKVTNIANPKMDGATYRAGFHFKP